MKGLICHGTPAVLSVYNLLILGCVEPFSCLPHPTTSPSRVSRYHTHQGPLTSLRLRNLGRELEGKPDTGIWAQLKKLAWGKE